MQRLYLVLTLGLAAVALGAAVALDNPAAAAPESVQTRQPDAPFVATPAAVVAAMLELAKVTKNDIVYDLGCGDGRIVIAAAKNYGARGVGIDLDPKLIKEATENAKKQGVSDRVTFVQADLFEADIRDATVVTLYLLPILNVKLRPRLLNELKPGTRVVSHDFHMDEWAPDASVELNGRRVYLWTVPARRQ
jgi:SAM-dependent methyltransferase